MPNTYREKREQLDREGYCLLESVIDEAMLAALREVTDQVLARQDETHFARNRSQGSLIRVTEHRFMARLIAYPPMLAALERLGFPDPKWGSGFIISKPPQSPPYSGTRTRAFGTIPSATRRGRFNAF